MKIHIWIKKEEVLNGKITEYLTSITNGQGTSDHVQVSITQDEFAQLEEREGYFNENADHIYSYNEHTGLAFKREEGNKYQTQQVTVEEYVRVKGGDFAEYWSALTEEQKEELRIKFNFKW